MAVTAPIAWTARTRSGAWPAFHARHGTTSLLATTVTAPAADLRRAMAGIAEAMREPGPGRANSRRPSGGPVHQPATRWARSRRSRSRPTSPCSRSWRHRTDPGRHLCAGDRPRRASCWPRFGAWVPAPRSAIPPAATPRRAPPWPRVPQASPISSTPCPACTIGVPGRSARRWRWRQSAELILDFHHVDEGAALRGAARHPAPALRHRRRGGRRHARRRVSPGRASASSSAATPSGSPTAASPAAC